MMVCGSWGDRSGDFRSTNVIIIVGTPSSDFWITRLVWNDTERHSDVTVCDQSLSGSRLSLHFAISIFKETDSSGSLKNGVQRNGLSITAGIVAHKRCFLIVSFLNMSVASLNRAFASSVTLVPDSAAERKARSHIRRILQGNFR